MFRKNLEHELCKELVLWSRLFSRKYPCLQYLYHIPNEGRRNPRIASEIGILSGVSDYHLPVRSGPHLGLYLEIKAPGKKPTVAQQGWLEEMRRQGHRAEWTDDLQTAINILEEYARGVLLVTQPLISRISNGGIQ